MKKVISDNFVQMADDELDRMWNEGTLNEERIESFRHLHERTPYNKPKYTFHCCPVKILKYHLSSNSRNSVLDIQALI